MSSISFGRREQNAETWQVQQAPFQRRGKDIPLLFGVLKEDKNVVMRKREGGEEDLHVHDLKLALEEIATLSERRKDFQP